MRQQQAYVRQGHLWEGTPQPGKCGLEAIWYFMLQSPTPTSNNFRSGPWLPNKENLLCPVPDGLPSLVTQGNNTLGANVSTSYSVSFHPGEDSVGSRHDGKGWPHPPGPSLGANQVPGFQRWSLALACQVSSLHQTMQLGFNLVFPNLKPRWF